MAKLKEINMQLSEKEQNENRTFYITDQYFDVSAYLTVLLRY